MAPHRSESMDDGDAVRLRKHSLRGNRHAWKQAVGNKLECGRAERPTAPPCRLEAVPTIRGRLRLGCAAHFMPATKAGRLWRRVNSQNTSTSVMPRSASFEMMISRQAASPTANGSPSFFTNSVLLRVVCRRPGIALWYRHAPVSSAARTSKSDPVCTFRTPECTPDGPLRF